MIGIDRLFDALFWPFRALPVVVSLVAFSLLAALLALVAFRYLSNQPAIRRAKDRMQAQLLAIRLFREQPRVVLRAYGRLLAAVLHYLAHATKPAAAMVLPLLLIFVQLDKRLSRMPVAPGQEFLLAARLGPGTPLDRVALRLPAELVLTAPPLHVPRDQEIVWRIQAREAGLFSAGIVVAGDAATKQIRVSRRLMRLSPERAGSGLDHELWDAEEAPLSREQPVRSIEVRYPSQVLSAWNFSVSWVVVFGVLMIAEMLLLRGLLRTEV